MKYKIPTIEELSVEMRNLTFFLEPEVESMGLNYSLVVDPVFAEGYGVVFHLRIICELSQTEPTDEKKDPITLYDISYLCEVEITDKPEPSDERVAIDEHFLSHLLGMCILMVRGAVPIRVQSSFLNKNTFPIINPNKILSERLEKKDGQFLLPLSSTQQPVGDSR